MKLNKIIVIESSAMGTDAYGGETLVWSEFTTVWAAVYPIKGRELIAAQAAQSQLTTTFEIRYWKGVVADMRILYDGNYYEIESVIDPQEKHLKMLIMAKCL